MRRDVGQPSLPGAMAVALVLGLLAGNAEATTPSQAGTAGDPASWLIVYSQFSPDSCAWAFWYRDQWDIPWPNLVNVRAVDSEHLPTAKAAQQQIISIVRDYLDNHPDVEQNIMGIVVGYDVPGHFAQPLLVPDTGGYSITDALQDMYDDDRALGLWGHQGGQRDVNRDCPALTGHLLPASGRLTKPTMAPRKYMAARIDAPTLEEAMELTLRAKDLALPSTTLLGQSVWYDYHDPGYPSSSHEWAYLRYAVEDQRLGNLPWSEFDLDSVGGGNGLDLDAFRFSIYKLFGWSIEDFESDAPGSRVLAFHHNSFGAVTVRSTEGEGGLYVPNAIAAGYAAAIGATAEPQCCQTPVPAVLLAALQEGWTLGEAYYLANPYNDWVWTLIGDPLLTVGAWFNEHGNMPDDEFPLETMNAGDMPGFRACMGGPLIQSPEACGAYDADQDADLDLFDFAAFQNETGSSPVEPRTGDADGDDDLDLLDYAALADCLTVPVPSVLDEPCRVLDLDRDLDIDLHDFHWFQARFPAEVQPLSDAADYVWP